MNMCYIKKKHVGRAVAKWLALLTHASRGCCFESPSVCCLSMSFLWKCVCVWGGHAVRVAGFSDFSRGSCSTVGHVGKILC